MIFKNAQEDNIKALLAHRVNVLLLGPTGSGKTETSKKVAADLGLEFYYCNAVLDEFKLTGFMNAMGHYQSTPFYEAFTKGGLFLFDEMDASIPEALLTINMALANGEMNFPDGLHQKHEDFMVIATANTIKGANINYTGRTQLDAASLNRFACLELDYDVNVEACILAKHLPGDDPEDKIQIQNIQDSIANVRDFDKSVGTEVTISTRLVDTSMKVRQDRKLVEAVLYNINESDAKRILIDTICTSAMSAAERKKIAEAKREQERLKEIVEIFREEGSFDLLYKSLSPLTDEEKEYVTRR